jgi:hypothetical protein
MDSAALMSRRFVQLALAASAQAGPPPAPDEHDYTNVHSIELAYSQRAIRRLKASGQFDPDAA